MAVWARIGETIAQHGRAALVSVVRVAGSAPRESGARLVARPDSGFFGTIGGGRLEYEVLAAAGAALARGERQALLRTWTLGPDLAQCCGGVVTTLTEVFDASDADTVAALAAAERSGPFATLSRLGEDGRVRREVVADADAAVAGTPSAQAPSGRGQPDAPFIEKFGDDRVPVLLFGAGHVGRALVLALAPLPFAVRWVDSRADQFPSHLPANTIPVLSTAPESEIDTAPDGALAVVTTHLHALDYAIAARALGRGGFAYVGMIGSATKRARFASHARTLGLDQPAIDRLVCPIGLPGIAGKAPAVIAASVAAQLLMVRAAGSP
ncbi:MAG: xanthine dehydrogenase accessory protein XdhC [Rhodovulum sp.]|nr:xanthine dehydrogenase accessory protein XdhC [Rhodovulum sp.]